jgi:hypothetical protein
MGQMRGKTLRGTPAAMDYAKPLREVPVAMIDVPLVRSVLQPIWHTKRVTASRLRNRIESVLKRGTIEVMTVFALGCSGRHAVPVQLRTLRL